MQIQCGDSRFTFFKLGVLILETVLETRKNRAAGLNVIISISEKKNKTIFHVL